MQSFNEADDFSFGLLEREKVARVRSRQFVRNSVQFPQSLGSGYLGWCYGLCGLRVGALRGTVVDVCLQKDVSGTTV
jgi:hypothetical protein